MGLLYVDTIEPQSGTALTVGESGQNTVLPGNDLRANVLQDAGGNAIFTSDGNTISVGTSQRGNVGATERRSDGTSERRNVARDGGRFSAPLRASSIYIY